METFYGNDLTECFMDIYQEEKLLIAQCICAPLMRKILADIQRNVEDGSTRLDSRYSKGE